MANEQFFVRFWGVRGSLPTPGPSTVEFGGNTPCVEIRCGDRVLIFDAGSGIHPLGDLLWSEGVKELDLFFTHTHYDHIGGLPFFAPFMSAETRIDIWSGHTEDDATTTKALVQKFMSPPFFPVPPEIFKAKVGYHDFTPGNQFDLPGGVTIKTILLNHPGGSMGYRIEFGGKSICYVTDTEHVPGKPDQNILGLIQDADVVIYDATYCDSDFERFVGFGHSTWQEGIRLCKAANAGKYCIFHHRPSHDDATMRSIEKQAQEIYPDSVVLREGMQINP